MSPDDSEHETPWDWDGGAQQKRSSDSPLPIDHAPQLQDADVRRRSIEDRFFAIDRRAFHFVCGLGLLSAVAYIILACGTGGDQSTTAWSAKAISKRTGVHWRHANEAIKRLVDHGAVRKDGTAARPRYRLLPVHEIPGCVGNDPQLTLTAVQEKVAREIYGGGDRYIPIKTRLWQDWGTSAPRAVADELVQLGWAVKLREGRYDVLRERFKPSAKDPVAKPDWVWLPATLVEGAAGETAPIERVRRLQSISTLRLLVDLYHAQNLAAHGGIDWRSICTTFEGQKVGQRGNDNVFEFRRTGYTQCSGTIPFVRPFMTGEMVADTAGGQKDAGWDAFWAAWKDLIRLNLLEHIEHLIEGFGKEAQIIHPCAQYHGEEIELRLGAAAHEAALSLLNRGQRKRLEDESKGICWLVPISADHPAPQMVGIYRLRYRPHTELTGQWFQGLVGYKEMAERFDALAARYQGMDPDDC